MHEKSISLTNKAFGGFAWMLMGTAIEMASRLLALMVLARLLSPDNFGVVGAAMIVVGFSTVFGQMGVGPALVQKKEITEKHVGTAFTLSILFGGVCGAIVFFLAPAFSDFFRMDELRPVLEVLSVIFLINGVTVVNESLLRRDFLFKFASLADSLSYLIGYALVGMVAAYLGMGVWALVAAIISQSLIKMIICIFLSPRKGTIALGKKEISELMNFGVGFSLARIANYGAGKADHFVIGRYLGMEFLGIYSRATEFLLMPTTVMGTIADKVLFPVMSSVQSDAARLKAAYMKITGAIAFLCYPVSALMIVLADEIVAIILGEGWEEVVLPMQVLAAILVFRTAYKISDCLARATGAVYRRAWRQWVYMIAVFVGAMMGQYHGLYGVAIGVATAVFINYLLMLQLSASLIGLDFLQIVKVHCRHILIALILGAVAFFCKEQVLYLGGGSILVVLLSLMASFFAFLLLYIFFKSSLGVEAIWLITVMQEKVKNRTVSLG